jgi:hypothetical protein
MRLTSITANRHIFDGQVNKQPLRLLLDFDDGRSLRVAVAGDGEQMTIDDHPLDEPFDMAEAGEVDIADVTELLDGSLRDAQVDNVRALLWNGCRVGVQLLLKSDRSFHIWVDGDELHWGSWGALIAHDWLDGSAPAVGDRVGFQSGFHP